MTAVLIVSLAVFLADRKITKIISLCLLPAFLLLPAFFRVNTIEGTAFYIGLILVGLAPILERLCLRFEPYLKIRKKTVQEEKACDTEDILDNKKKWGLIKAGFIILIIMAVISVVSILRLNTKVNNMYEYSIEQQDTIEEQQKEIEELKNKVGNK